MVEYIFNFESVLSEPDYIFKGKKNELIAVKRKTKSFFLVIIYKEDKENNDGFIITAFKTKSISYLLKKKIVWKKK